MVEVARDVRGAVVGGGRAEVGDGHPEREGAGELDVEGHSNDLHDGRVDDERDGAWVVHGRVVEPLLIFVGVTEEREQVTHEPCRAGADGGDRGRDLGGCQGLVREVESDHREWPLLVEDDVRGLGVDDDVELARRAPVAHVDPAAHEHDLLDAFGDARFLPHGERDVREGTGRHEGDLAGLGRHDGVDDEVDGVPGVEFDGGLRQHGPIEA